MSQILCTAPVNCVLSEVFKWVRSEHGEQDLIDAILRVLHSKVRLLLFSNKRHNPRSNVETELDSFQLPFDYNITACFEVIWFETTDLQKPQCINDRSGFAIL